MSVSDLNAAINAIAPFTLGAEWDNVGLLVGRSEAPCERVLLCIDLTEAVLQEAIELKVQAVVAYHPVVFKPIPYITDLFPQGRVLLGLIEAGIAVISPHTALDAAPDGMTDWLAQGIGGGSTRPIHPESDHRADEAYELTVMVPRDAVDAVRTAAAAAGAGRIGDYDTCSTAAEVIGTFRGGDGTSPTVGEAGKVEQVEEFRLTLPCGVLELAGAIEAIRAAHPYEEPPIHVVSLMNHPLTDRGEGRVLTLDEPATIEVIADRLKLHLDVPSLRMVKASEDPHSVAGCCPGSGGSLLHPASAAGATLFVTGEMRHHDLLEAKANGVSVLLAGHTNTERGFLPHLAARLAGMCSNMTFTVSKADTAPWCEV